MEYGKGSKCEFYGTTEFDENNGKIQMNVHGIIPIMPRPREDVGSDDAETESFL
jgi:hypothetical protein